MCLSSYIIYLNTTATIESVAASWWQDLGLSVGHKTTQVNRDSTQIKRNQKIWDRSQDPTQYYQQKNKIDTHKN